MSTQTLSVSETKAQEFVNTVDGAPRTSSLIHQGIDPSTKKKLWDVPIATEKDLDDAVTAAQNSFKTWSKTSWESRQEVLERMRQILVDHRDEMSQILSTECGKPVSKFVTIACMAALTRCLATICSI